MKMVEALAIFVCQNCYFDELHCEQAKDHSRKTQSTAHEKLNVIENILR